MKYKLNRPKNILSSDKLIITWGNVRNSSLLQNYPNPFNPDTWIPYQLTDDANVKINIYNGLGQLIRTLDLGLKPAGIYVTKDKSAYWDGMNRYGEKVSSGVYYYSIQADSFIEIRKMIVMK